MFFLGLCSAGAFAQSGQRDVGKDERIEQADAGIDEIVVTGQALSLRRAAEVKRDANVILDAAVQDDIGRLPDLNTASVIRRLPGVSVQNDQGEPRFPVIRGLNPTYNRTTIDGGIVASPERGNLGRAVPLDVIPASLLSRLEVYKTMLPSMDGNAIGGTINVVTRSAFTEAAPFFYGATYVGQHEQDEGETLDGEDDMLPWRANFAAGTTFGSRDQFGAVIGVDYSIRNFAITQIEVDDSDYTQFGSAGENVGAGSGAGPLVPTNNRIFYYNNVRERLGGNVKLEWRPNAKVLATFSGLYASFNDDERRDENRYELGECGSSACPETITPLSDSTGLTQTGYGIVGLGRFTLNRDIYSLQGDIEWEPVEGVTLHGQMTYAGAELDNPESTESFQTGTDFGAVYDLSTFFPRTYPADPAGFYDPESYIHVSRGELSRYVEDDIYEFTGSAGYTLDSVPLTLSAGGLYRTREKSEGFVFNGFTQTANLGYTLADAFDTGLADVAFQGNYNMPLRTDSDAANEFFAVNRSAFVNSGTSMSASRAEEDVTAGYVMGTLEFGDGRGELIGGARVEVTEWNGGPVGGEPVSGNYTNVLPGLHGRYEVRDNLVLRGAVSLTIGRPDISGLTRGRTVDLVEMTVSRSNPELEPRKSTNYDLSAEWYVPAGLIAVGAFYKDISDEIFTLTSNTSVTIDDVTFDTVTQPVNATDAEILGVEFQYQQSLTFLPEPWNGFGVSTNLTALDTEFVVPLADGRTRTVGFFQQPELLFNVTPFYANERFEIRASYNYTGEFLDEINDDPRFDTYWDARETVDLQARVNLTDGLSLVGEISNLTDSGRTEVTGPGRNLLQEDARFRRTFWLGFTARL